MRRKITSVLVGLGVLGGTLVAATGSAQSHGYADSATSRQQLCATGAVRNCGQIQWEPESVEGLKGFPSAGPADGRICAGGNGRFSELDDPRGGAWPTTQLSSGQSHTFSWRIKVRHATSDFRYYITKDGYNPAKPLTRADLEPQPFLTVPFGGVRPAAVVTHNGTLPQKSGRHLILGVWTIADTANAFYACSDVRF
ncbi:lytic polysaccharide monooxygenase auxiliary activity family 9 protein [Streptomyces clavuligerus]|uniref:Putative secreted chitin-binding protein n=1 Tax=Streptomyces clavuligerus TaxID=1901 RepID=B5GN81_STRCL|nr:lytic polysaccharide monooxygenase auxiliary activity family 9 protein [Streptomyces clavuligerus]ANW22176.1 chitin-binding protein [Streptomyces clavuligerus]AXU17067.1 chitin-binding protein [Streptomyces clavuligerus]EDY47777.1 chitin-binding protein [Streptomyces clavuligerus]EFG04234.1 putative secreted chitin-binding protein [Streptomyces clavuligerus]MBY6307289.1 lytic polysaccharide monooxygenase [Streptomyces clavuligerus]